MKQYLPLLALAVSAVLLCTQTASAGNAAAARTTPSATTTSGISYRTGIVILKLAPTVANRRGSTQFELPALDAIMQQLGADSRRPLFPLAPYSEKNLYGTSQGDGENFDRVYVINYSAPFDALEAAQRIKATGLMEFAEPYYTFPLLYKPNDPGLVAQSWLTIIQAQQAWDITKGDSSIIIGIIDTGVEWSHEDLTQNIYINPGETGKDSQGRDKQTNGIDDDGNGYKDDYHGWDFVGNPTLPELQSGQYHPDNDPSPHAVSISGYEGYHGTLVAGCASARPDNGKGLAGPGFYAKLLPVKCASDSIGTSQVVAGYDGIRYAADMGARVINCSWGGPGTPAQFQALQSVIDYVHSKGALIVGASGNAGSSNDQTPNIPTDLRHVLSVGATDANDSAASFANYGVGVDVWAPGVNIYSTYPGNQYLGNNVSGTSFSAPIVSGIASLVFAMHPTWDPDQVAMQLRVTGDRVKTRFPEYGPYFFRRANAYRAVSINQNLSNNDPNNLPGLGLVSYKINGRAVDTIKSLNQTVDVEVTLQNYLAPTRTLKIGPFAGQTLTSDSVELSEPVGTLEQTTQTLHARISPSSSVVYSEGNVQFILHLTDDSGYEDFVAIPIPISLPGWHQQVNPLETAPVAYVGASIKAVSPTLAWAIANVQTGQTTYTPLFTRTINNAASWQPFQQSPAGQEPIYCIQARSDLEAWAGSGPSSQQAAVFHTTDGGSNWTRVSVSSITPFVNSVHFFDAANGIALGDPLNSKWGIAKTSDGGATWKALSTPVTASSATEAGWNNSYAAVGDSLWFGTNTGRIYRSSDRGQTWTATFTPSLNCLGLAFADSKRGLACFSPTTTTGGTDMIAYTTDGGVSWKPAPMPFTGASPEGVTFVPGTMRAFVGTQNGVFETNDLGQTWKQMAMPQMTFLGMLLSSASDASGNVTAFGTNIYSQLMIYRDKMEEASVDITASPVVTSNATLYPSIPNPFSTSTTISFDLHKSATVELSLCDMLGNRVKALAQGTMEPGSHAVKLDAAGLPSGTYVVTLVVNGQRLSRQIAVMR